MISSSTKLSQVETMVSTRYRKIKSVRVVMTVSSKTGEIFFFIFSEKFSAFKMGGF